MLVFVCVHAYNEFVCTICVFVCVYHFHFNVLYQPALGLCSSRQPYTPMGHPHCNICWGRTEVRGCELVCGAG